jgi:DNA-binding NtrC family response regulator
VHSEPGRPCQQSLDSFERPLVLAGLSENPGVIFCRRWAMESDLAIDGGMPQPMGLAQRLVPMPKVGQRQTAGRMHTPVVGEALAQARGSRTDAARILGMPRTALINKLRRYGLK